MDTIGKSDWHELRSRKSKFTWHDAITLMQSLYVLTWFGYPTLCPRLLCPRSLCPVTLSTGHFVPGHFVPSHFVPLSLCPPFTVLDHFVLWSFCPPVTLPPVILSPVTLSPIFHLRGVRRGCFGVGVALWRIASARDCSLLLCNV
jgi:hypothetical protein